MRLFRNILVTLQRFTQLIIHYERQQSYEHGSG